MSYNIYYSPEAFALRIVGQVEFSSGLYEFDTFALWQDVRYGDFFYAQDHGCSCPTPFDSIDRTNIIPVRNLGALISALDDAKAASFYYSPGDPVTEEHTTRIDGQVADLIRTYREAKDAFKVAA